MIPVVPLNLGRREFSLGFPGVVLMLTFFPVYQIIGNVVDEFVANNPLDLCFIVLCFL